MRKPTAVSSCHATPTISITEAHWSCLDYRKQKLNDSPFNLFLLFYFNSFNVYSIFIVFVLLLLKLIDLQSLHTNKVPESNAMILFSLHCQQHVIMHVWQTPKPHWREGLGNGAPRLPVERQYGKMGMGLSINRY